MRDDLILAIESSCDETAAAVVKGGKTILSNIINSQVDIHAKFGGVVPEIAARSHVDQIVQIVDLALKTAKVKLSDLSAIAVTNGPGLVGPLLVGVSFAKALSFSAKLPLIAVNHMHGHIAANYLDVEDVKGIEPPFVCLVVSGGHTNIIMVEDYLHYNKLAETRDDAAGEAFDKVARSLGLGYPGGPKIDRLAKTGNPNSIHFPRARVSGSKYDFSFSGIKSAVLNYINSCDMKGETYLPEDVAASFQHAVIEALSTRCMDVLEEYRMNSFAIAGGVAANSALREHLRRLCELKGIGFHYPSMQLCTDNAAMIAAAAHHQLLKGEFRDLSLNAVPSLSF